MTYDLIHTLEEVTIRFDLHVQRSCSPCRRVQPSPRLRRNNVASVEVCRRAGPTSRSELPPVSALTFWQINQRVAGKRRRRDAIDLPTKASAVSMGPGVDRLEISLIDQLGQRARPVE